MNYQQLLFSFDGRIRRMHYWLGALGTVIAFCIIAAILGMVFGGGAGATSQNGAGAMGIVGMILYVAVAVVYIWILLALQVKRWHDRDKSWVWVFINLIPLIGGLWTLVECGFLDGTQGPNRFGPSPKGIAGPATPAAAAGPAA
jgi:uncharacterized membrane protein YhaH (DUF805 family)